MWYKIGPSRPPDWMGKPPQMLAQDVDVWHAWLEKHQDEIEKIYYNTAITTIKEPEHGDQRIINNWMYSVSKRLDAIVEYKDGRLFIVEVTRKAGLRAIGQAITYKFLWGVIDPMGKPADVFILCIFADQDVQAVAREYGIGIVQERELG